MKALRIVLVVVMMVFIANAVWGKRDDKPRFPASTYKTTAKIHLKDEYRLYDSAVVILEEAVQFYDDDAEMHFLLGKAYYLTNNFRGMGEQFAAAESLKGKKDKWIDELKAMKDEKWTQFFNQGATAFNEQNYDTALVRFETCRIIDPTRPRSYLYSGLAYTVKGEYEKALASLETTLKLDPDNVDAQRGYGDVLFYMGNQKKALETYNNILKKDPTNVELLFNVATIYYNDGDYVQAISNFEKLVAQSPDHKDAYFNMGSAYLRKKVFLDESLDSLKDENGEYRQDTTSQARVKELNQQINEILASAQTAFEKVVELDTTDLESQALLAGIYQEQDDFDSALPILESLVEKDSTNCKAWQQLAFIYAKKNIGKKATEAFQKAQDCFKGTGEE
jgi:cytochrome c-type biogenesis protein CcmH/NrfG